MDTAKEVRALEEIYNLKERIDILEKTLKENRDELNSLLKEFSERYKYCIDDCKIGVLPSEAEEESNQVKSIRYKRAWMIAWVIMFLGATINLISLLMNICS